MVAQQFQLTVFNGRVNIFAGSICPGDAVLFTNKLKGDITITFPVVSPFKDKTFVVGGLPVQQKVKEDAFGDFSFTATDSQGKPLSGGLIAVGQCISVNESPTRIIYEADEKLTVGISILEGNKLLFLSNPVGTFQIEFLNNQKWAPLTDTQGLRLPNPFQVNGSRETIAADVNEKQFTFKAKSLNVTEEDKRSEDLQTGGAEQGDLIFIPNDDC